MTAQRKAPEGLTKVLFVRISDDLLAKLDAFIAKQRKKNPGRSITRSDAVREMIYETTVKRGNR